MPFTQKRKALAAVTAATIIAGGLYAYLVAGSSGGASRVDTSLDASTNLVPPKDWRFGYSRTGAICYPQDTSSTEGKTFAADVLPYTADATDAGWAIEPTQTNRFPVNTGMACGGLPWVCSTATMDSTSTAPDSTATASLITLGGGSLDATAFGYTALTALDFRVWATCDGTGTLDATHVGETGHWTVDATAMGNGWRLLYPARTEVTEVGVMTSDASGNFRLRLSGKGCTIWMPTATEATSYHHSTIPTDDATGETVGAPSWTVDNATGAYWAAAGVTKVETATVYAGGACWSYAGTTITLSANNCNATLYALSLTWGY